MANDIKNLLDSIISGPDVSEGKPTDPITPQMPVVNHDKKPVQYDSIAFRERLSLAVLNDIISAMMHDETEDLNGMIDQSIMKHIHDDYKGTCFGYLCKARDKLQSPILSDVVQEIESKVENTDDTIKRTGVIDNSVENPDIATKDLLNNVQSYDELRQKLKDEVSKKVVNDVTKVITKSNDAPMFDNIDKTIKKEDEATSDTGEQSGEQPQTDNNQQQDQNLSESVIMRMTSSIVTEQALEGNHISTDEGINRAIITYCISEMDALFDYDRSRSLIRKYTR